MTGPHRHEHVDPPRTSLPEQADPEQADPEVVGDEGRAIVEVVFAAVLVLIPLVYVLIIVISLQSATMAVAQAARDVGRIVASAPTPQVALDRAQEMARISLTDQGLPAEEVQVYFVAPEAGCDGAAVPLSFAPGTVLQACVRTVVQLPGVPTVLTGSRNTVTGAALIRVSEVREG